MAQQHVVALTSRQEQAIDQSLGIVHAIERCEQDFVFPFLGLPSIGRLGEMLLQPE